MAASANPARQLAHYNARIAACEAELDGLRRQRAVVRTEAAAIASAFAPIRRLPVELLCEVFDLCAPSGLVPVRKQGVPDTGSPQQELERLRKPWLVTLSQVSCHWRRLIHGTPKLWAHIAIETGTWGSCGVRPTVLLALLDTCLTHSTGAPLTLRVITESDDRYASDVFARLVPHSARWREADIRIDRNLLHLLGPVRGNLPLLEKLGLHTRAETVSMFAEAPRLREVIFWGPSTCLLTVPWSRVDVFRACGGPMETRTALSFMGALPSGASAYFYINAQRMPPPNVPLPHVRSVVRRFGIDVGCCFDPPVSGAAVRRLWDGVTFTGLYHLHLKARRTHPAPMWHHTSFMAMAERSGFARTLVSLTLRTFVGERELGEVLAPLKALEKLDLTDVVIEGKRIVITDGVLRLLAVAKGVLILPRLQRLYLRTLLGFDEHVFVRFVESRVDKGLTFLGVFWVPRPAAVAGDEILTDEEEESGAEQEEEESESDSEDGAEGSGNDSSEEDDEESDSNSEGEGENLYAVPAAASSATSLLPVSARTVARGHRTPQRTKKWPTAGLSDALVRRMQGLAEKGLRFRDGVLSPGEYS
ncbi:hypothetical protein MIND_01339000 [Mycena indigotica]|uniref:F-box domain-containing protein n=1 Tax=Mycena indigotica TaxID=2126181 RepID=A0A8H6VU77_9AGAR|nr:uncharacterized protein MIND_01339000 [Mycena indigotica]KAF7290253.1 hypothetical protein MIND_01339000 [Mycena indigotica]